MFDFLMKLLDKLAIIISAVTLVKFNQENKDLKDKLEIRDEVAAIKDANSKLSRDELINGLLTSDDVERRK